MPIQQKNRVMGVKTPLDDDLLLLQSVNAKELMSGLFEYTLDLVSEAPDIDFNELVGEQMTVRFEMAGGETRFFNGYVSRFSQAGFEDTLSKYQATLVPWLWFLTRTSDCRIFQNMKIPDVIKNVFRENGFSDFEDLLTEEYREWENCVQYAETDFNFVSRLMEQEGISYYFTQEADKHTLVLSDSYNAHQSKEGYEIVPFFPPDSTAIRERDHISAWSTSRQVQPGVYVHNDFDFKKPKKVLESKTSTPRKHAASDYEIFFYPGEYTEKADGENYSKVRLQELQARFETFEGSGNVQGLSAGCLFELENLPREDQNGEYLVTSIHYKLESDRFGSGETAGGATFQCQFSSISSKESFRPGKQTPKPKVQGLQTAIVVGKAGEEIWTDEFGRVKVQFHWDRYGNSDENSSCWVRVAQVWAGKK
ncbi:MAG: type VI secretion system Vgr family protein [Nitrospinota bacterium]